MQMRLFRRIRLLFVASVLVPGAFAQKAAEPDAIAAALRDQAYSKALGLLRPALQRNPSDPRLWAMQGTALAGTGDTHQALDAFH